MRIRYIINYLTRFFLLRLAKLNLSNKSIPRLFTLSNDYLGSFVNTEGMYEKDLLHELKRSLGSEFNNKLFLDIGANIGNHSIFLASSFEEVHSFEPNPDTLPILKHNINFNNIDNINVHQYGIGNENTELELHTPSFDLGKSSIFKEPVKYSEQGNSYVLKSRKVQIKKLDDIEYFKNKKIGMIKIDIEGSEILALKGAKSVIEYNMPLIGVEVHQFDGPTGLEEITKFFKGLGYDVFFTIDMKRPSNYWLFNNFVFKALYRFIVGTDYSIQKIDKIENRFYQLFFACTAETYSALKKD